MKLISVFMPLKTVGFFLFFWWMSSVNIYSQSLNLLVEGSNIKETKIIDSLSYKKTFTDFSSLQKEVDLFKKRLTNLGYIENELIGLIKQNDTSFFATYHLKKLYKTIRIYFDNSINKNVLKMVSSDVEENYFEIEITALEATLQLLNSELSDQGDPFSTLQLSNINKTQSNDLFADLIVSEQKQQRTIDSIIIKGYEKFPKSFVKRYLKLNTSQPFQLNTIKNKTSQLEDLSFASQIKEPEVLFTKDSTLLYIYVEKQKSNTFDGFLGFGTNAETNKVEFNGFLNLNLINNLNYGESFRLLYKSDESEQKTFDVNARLPYLLGSPIGTELGLNIFKKDSTFVTVAQTAKLNFQINPKNLVSFSVNSINSTNLLETTSLFVDDYKSVFYSLDYLYIKTQRYDQLFPVNFQLDISTGIGNRFFEDLRTPQTKINLNTVKIFNLNDKNSFFMRATGASLISDNFFENELFRFGGINSIRGFEENSLTANSYIVFNTEYRYEISTTFYIHSVLDGAYFENELIDTKGKLFGFGFGFGLLTKSGLFKLNYSNGKNENQKFKFSDSKIHLSLTARF